MTEHDDAHTADSAADFGDEANRLLAAVQDWTKRTFPAPPSGHGGPECQWCPLCQLAAAMRGEHPELTERIAEAGAAVANALRALAESSPARPPRARPAQATAVPHPADRPTPRPRVQRIALDDEPGEP
jgi:hypothetical protein